MEDLLSSFNLNSHTLGVHLQTAAPCKSLNSTTRGIGQAGDQDGWVLVKLSFLVFGVFMDRGTAELEVHEHAN